MKQSLLRSLWGILLLAGLEAQAQKSRSFTPSDAGQTRWLDIDSSPWLRGIRRFPTALDRSVAYWQQLIRQHPQPDTVRVVLLDRLADAQASRNLKAAYPTYQAALRLAYRLPYPQIRAEALLQMADYHTRLAQYDSAARYLPAAEQQFRLDRNRGGVARCLLRLGRITDQQGRYAASLSYNLRALALAPNIGNTRRFHTTAQIQLGTLYAQVGNYAEARRYLLAAQHIATEHDYPDRQNLALGELGEVCRRLGQWRQARTYFRRSIAISRRLGNVPYALAMQLNLARLREDQGQYAAAAAEGEQVLRQMQAADLPLLVPRAQALLARVVLHQGQVEAAIAYGQQSLVGGQQARLLTGIAEATAVLAEAYAQKQEYRLALAALRRYHSATDSLVGEITRRRLAVLQVNQQQREQQAQIRLLTQQNRLQGQAQELTRLRNERTVIGLSALTLLALLLAGGLLWQYRRRQARRELQLRTQIAADLHDEVGTLLSQISLQSSLLQEGLPDVASQRQQLGQLSEASRSAVRQLNDVVWSLDAHNDTLPQLLDRLRDYAYEVLPAAGILVTIEAPPDPPVMHLSLLLRRNLYAIYKEALHNVLKHAPGTSQVHIALQLDTGRLLLNIRNEAHLVQREGTPAGPSRRSGHGLRNIAQRAAALGGVAACGPLPEGGFRVRVQLPL